MPGRKTSAGHGESGGAGAQRSAGRRKSSPPAAAAALPRLRTSERSTLKKCEFVWDLEFNQFRKPLVSMPALRFGTLIHKGLAAYYVPGVKRGVHPAVAFEKAYHEEQELVKQLFGVKVTRGVEKDEKWVNALELGVAMLENYVDEYGKDDRWEVLVTEMPFQRIVYRPDSYDPNHPPEAQESAVPWFLYVGVIDGAWRDRSDKSVWIPDHKTASSLGDNKLNYLQMDDQAGMYWSHGVDALIAKGLLKNDRGLNGMLYNFLRKSLPDERPSILVNGKRMYLNQPTKKEPRGAISKVQPAPYFLRQPIFRDEFERNMAKHRATIDWVRMELLRGGQLEYSKTPGQFTCPSCWARDICELHETGNDWQSVLEETTRSWDPYAEHEVYAGEQR